ncbi:MAG: polysaccharide deacetylase family protein [Acidobacteria bacterium]|nr:polysaccharide deacetylase family protein [Acidobacteriota bacterium]
MGLHRVLPEEQFARGNSLPGMLLKEETFDSLLEYLRAHYEVKPLDAILERKDKERSPDKPLCTLTFDDGWRDNYTVAYPRLKGFGMPATIFLVTGYLDGYAHVWVERLCQAWKEPSQRELIKCHAMRLFRVKLRVGSLEEIVECLKRLPGEERRSILIQLLPAGTCPNIQQDPDPMMSWEEAVEMSRHGIDFGSHTTTHPLLTFESDDTVESELKNSKARIEERVGKPVWAFAYPNGDWDSRIRKWIERTGYRCAVTTKRGWHESGLDPYSMRRILIHEGNVTGWSGKFSAAAFNFTVAPWR